MSTRSERRRTRASLTRALARIAARIAASPAQPVEWENRRVGSRDRATVTATRLWVAGSYARGAAECGDLDLIVEVVADGHAPPARTIANRLFGRAQDTVLYLGTPEHNSAIVAFPEARLVWSREAPDWRANLGGIGSDPAAGRFERPLDALPLRPDQLAADLETLERVLAGTRDGSLRSRFVAAAELREDAALLAGMRVRAERYGARTAEVLRLALPYLAERAGADSVRVEEQGTLRFQVGGTLLAAGAPPVLLPRLETPFHDALALMPHLSRRGPNGLWLLERGPEHPVEKRFAERAAFHVTLDGAPLVVHDESHSRTHAAAEIALFTSEEDARERAEDEAERTGEPDGIAVAHAAGTALLGLLAGCDLVSVDGDTRALSKRGELALAAWGQTDAGRADAATLSALLAG